MAEIYFVLIAFLLDIIIRNIIIGQRPEQPKRTFVIG